MLASQTNDQFEVPGYHRGLPRGFLDAQSDTLAANRALQHAVRIRYAASQIPRVFLAAGIAALTAVDGDGIAAHALPPQRWHCGAEKHLLAAIDGPM